MATASMTASMRAAGVPGFYAQTSAKLFSNGTEDAAAASIVPAQPWSMQLSAHPASGTLCAEKFTQGMEPAMASVYPGDNGMAGVAGDFDKIYLPRPLVRKVHSGRPLMQGETQARPADASVATSFHETISKSMPAEDLYNEDRPYTVPKYAPDFPLEANMDPQRLHAGYMQAPDIPTAVLPAKPSSPMLGVPELPAFPPDSPTRKNSSPHQLSDSPVHSTFISGERQRAGDMVHVLKTHAAGAKQGKYFTDRLW